MTSSLCIIVFLLSFFCFHNFGFNYPFISDAYQKFRDDGIINLWKLVDYLNRLTLILLCTIRVFLLLWSWDRIDKLLSYLYKCNWLTNRHISIDWFERQDYLINWLREGTNFFNEFGFWLWYHQASIRSSRDIAKFLEFIFTRCNNIRLILGVDLLRLDFHLFLFWVFNI